MSKFYKMTRNILAIIAVLLFISSIILMFSGVKLSIFFAAFTGLFMLLFLAIEGTLWNQGMLKSLFVLRTIICVIAISFVVIEGMIILVPQQQLNYVDAVIVLGVGTANGEVSMLMKDRLDTTYDFLQTHPETVAVLSGGQGADETNTEASVMWNYLVQKGIDRYRLKIEDKSSDTHENFANSKVVLDNWFLRRNYTTCFITNSFHVFRSSLEAKKVGLATVGIPAPTTWYMAPNYYIREYFGVVQFLLFGK